MKKHKQMKKHKVHVCKLNGRKHIHCYKTESGYRFSTVLLVPVKDLPYYNCWQLYRVFKDVIIVVKRHHLSKETIEVMNEYKNIIPC